MALKKLVDILELKKQIDAGHFRVWVKGDSIYISHLIQDDDVICRGDTFLIGNINTGDVNMEGGK